MNDADAIELLRRMVAIQSPSGGEQEVARFLVEEARRRGLDGHVDEVGNAVIEAGTGPHHLVLLGHIDTVPGDIPVRIEDGLLYGRGTVDAKGSMASFVVALARSVASSTPMPRVTIVGCVEEEAPSSRGARHVIDRLRPDACVVGEPSGSDRVTIGYKGYLLARLRTEREVAHSAHQRETAVERAFAIWGALRAATDHRNRDCARSFDELQTSLLRARSGSDGLSEWAELDVMMRLPVDLPAGDAEAFLIEHADDARIELARPAIDAWHGSRSSPIMRSFHVAVAEEGRALRQVVKSGTADANLVAPAWGCPTVAYGPGDAALDHTPNEHIEIDEYLRGARVMERVIAHQASARSPASSGASGSLRASTGE